VVKMRHALPTPAADMHPHIIRAPPPNFAVGFTIRLPRELSPARLQHHDRPPVLTGRSFVSSEKITFAQSLAVQWRCWRGHSSHRRMCESVRAGFRGLTRATRPCHLSARRMVLAETAGRPRLAALRDSSEAVSKVPDSTRRLTTRSSRSDSSRAGPRCVGSLVLGRPRVVRRKRLTQNARFPTRRPIW